MLWMVWLQSALLPNLNLGETTKRLLDKKPVLHQNHVQHENFSREYYCVISIIWMQQKMCWVCCTYYLKHREYLLPFRRFFLFLLFFFFNSVLFCFGGWIFGGFSGGWRGVLEWEGFLHAAIRMEGQDKLYFPPIIFLLEYSLHQRFPQAKLRLHHFFKHNEQVGVAVS